MKTLAGGLRSEDVGARHDSGSVETIDDSTRPRKNNRGIKEKIDNSIRPKNLRLPVGRDHVII